MSIREIRARLPEEMKKWTMDKYRYRFPGGESQQDLALALEPLVMELERQQEPCLVISHSSTLQVLLGYFVGISMTPDKYHTLTIPRHTVIELIPSQCASSVCRVFVSSGSVCAAILTTLGFAVNSHRWMARKTLRPAADGRPQARGHDVASACLPQRGLLRALTITASTHVHERIEKVKKL